MLFIDDHEVILKLNGKDQPTKNKSHPEWAVLQMGFGNNEAAKAKKAGYHNEDHYLLVFQKNGRSRLIVDFKEVIICENTLLVILPGQTYFAEGDSASPAWIIQLNAAWVNASSPMVLHFNLVDNTAVTITAAHAKVLEETFSLLVNVYQKKEAADSTDRSISALLNSYLSLFGSFYLEDIAIKIDLNSRLYTITRQFRLMLHLNINLIKTPKEYGDALRLSASYLNEAIKQTTGRPVSYWIHYKILLEAKRLLFYTNSTVTEIAFGLGFDDHAYFIRLFSNMNGLSPLQFRKQIREKILMLVGQDSTGSFYEN